MKELSPEALGEIRERQKRREGIVKSRTELITRIGTGEIKPTTDENKSRIRRVKGRVQYSVYYYRARIAEDSIEIARAVSPEAVKVAEKELEFVLFEYEGWQGKKKRTPEFQTERSKRLADIENLRKPVVSELLFQQALRNTESLSASQPEPAEEQLQREITGELLPITAIAQSGKEPQNDGEKVDVGKSSGKEKKTEEKADESLLTPQYLAKKDDIETILSADEYALYQRLDRGHPMPIYEEDLPELVEKLHDVFGSLSVKLGVDVLAWGEQAGKRWFRLVNQSWAVQERTPQEVAAQYLTSLEPQYAVVRGREMIMLTPEEYTILMHLREIPNHTKRSDRISGETGIKAGPVMKSLMKKFGEGFIIQSGRNKGTTYTLGSLDWTGIEPVDKRENQTPEPASDSHIPVEPIPQPTSTENDRSSPSGEEDLEGEIGSDKLTRELTGYIGDMLIQHNYVIVNDNGNSFTFSLSSDLASLAQKLRDEIITDETNQRLPERIARAKRNSALERLEAIIGHEDADKIIESYEDSDMYELLMDLHTHPQLAKFHGHFREFLASSIDQENPSWTLQKELSPFISTWMENYDWNVKRNLERSIDFAQRFDAPEVPTEFKSIRRKMRDTISEFVNSEITYRKYTGNNSWRNRQKGPYTFSDCVLFSYLSFLKTQKVDISKLTPEELQGIRAMIEEKIAEKNPSDSSGDSK